MIHFVYNDTIDLTWLVQKYGSNTARIRRYLIRTELDWKIANQLSCFAVYGPKFPNGQRTINPDVGELIKPHVRGGPWGSITTLN